ncbi:dimeric dUTPase [Mycoplasma haemocanis str. Illinois]|uniref:Dimeric dUTPase n=1 Tax=Mycoplasma haemocanis (strain Illinois) TaxID=1111676 RepID=H6N5K3_MYCHN|nr:dUTP diphosphatase [Mycoplasma haemocanis]AEW44963.1 dimeric dUTPase [Mycoplasma haemocanis str. Illinois]
MSVDIDWQKLLEGQSKLDNYIFEKRGTSYLKTSSFRRLALLVELGELANACKPFKFWSVSEPNMKEVLDEYADIMHFVLAVSLERNYDLSGIKFLVSSEVDKEGLTDVFLNLIIGFALCKSQDDFRGCVSKFLELGSMLGFSFESIEKAYWDKWQVNFDRQNSNY